MQVPSDVVAIDDRKNVVTIDEAFEYCAKLTTSHYENFPVASLFLPQEQRAYIQAVYAFSRTADDIADEHVRSPSARIEDLDKWEEQLHDCYHGKASHPVFVALAETVHQMSIPIEPLVDLIAAFRQDVSVHRYGTFTELLEYCRRSANPVGRLVLMIFGYRDDELFRRSDSICTALQLANFWQDVDVDRGIGRCYIPIEDIDRFHYSLDRWEERVCDDAFRDLMKFEVDRTKELFYDGAPLPASVEKDLRLELKLVWFGGMRILRKIERQKYDTFAKRPRLGALDKFLVLSSGLLIDDLSRFGRKSEKWSLE
jgi:squalene synthase HpnC